MKKYLILLITVLFSEVIQACDTQQIRQLIQQGYSNRQIDELCNSRQLDFLVGYWIGDGAFTECAQYGAGCGPIQEVYEIRVSGSTIELFAIYDVHMGPNLMRKKRKSLSDFRYDGKILSFVINAADNIMPVPMYYKLQKVNDGLMKGRITMPGLMGMQGVSGDIQFRKVNLK